MQTVRQYHRLINSPMADSCIHTSMWYLSRVHVLDSGTERPKEKGKATQKQKGVLCDVVSD